MNDFEKLKTANKIVIKVGTSSLTHSSGKLNLRLIERLTRVLSDLKNAGNELVLVTSGAIGVGVGKLNLHEKPAEIPYKQALAAVGQSQLMAIYDKLFGEMGVCTAQVLLTKNILEDSLGYENIVNSFAAMFEYGVLPIVNENDVVSTYEIQFGDNDTLSAYVAKFINADLLIILTDIDGLYSANPKEDASAKLIKVVPDITADILNLGGTAGTTRGVGGMATKLAAAQIAVENGINMVITNGSRPHELYDILEGKPVGTLFIGR